MSFVVSDALPSAGVVVAAMVVTAWLLRSGRLAVLVGAGAAVCAASAVALYAAFGAAVSAWDEHPVLVADLTAVLLGLLALASLGVRSVGVGREPGGADGGEEDGGGGGGSRTPPEPAPRGAPPSAPVLPDAWADFDAQRAEWGRVPAGRT